MNKPKFSNKDIANMIERYLSGESISSIAKSMNATYPTIKSSMKRLGFSFENRVGVDGLKRVIFKGAELYVSEEGEVYREHNGALKKLKAWRHSQTVSGIKYEYGHKGVSFLASTGKRTTTLVSRLVALAFIPNPDNLPVVMHIDETLDKNGFLDNSVDNLRWGTYGENTQQSIKGGRMLSESHRNALNSSRKTGEDHHKAKLTNAQRDEIRTLYATGSHKQKTLAKMFDVSPPTINRIVAES